MPKMDVATFDDKQPIQDSAKKPLTKKLKDGEAVKTSLYIAPETHKALHYMALEKSFAVQGDKTRRKQVRVNDLIIKAIEMFLKQEEAR